MAEMICRPLAISRREVDIRIPILISSGAVHAILADKGLRRPPDPTSEPSPQMIDSWATWALGCLRSVA
jgi:hypothetical protein